MARDGESRRGKGRRPGPGVNLVKLELAAELRVCCLDWQEISRATGVPYQTLMRWQTRPEWAEAIGRLRQEQLNLLRLGRRVLAKKLTAGLRATQSAKGAVELAERLERMLNEGRNGDGEYAAPASATGQTAVFMVPMPDRGLESKPAHEVLGRPPKPPDEEEPPAAAALGAKKARPKPGTPSKRRIVAEEEGQ